jgi:hypothetical protein
MEGAQGAKMERSLDMRRGRRGLWCGLLGAMLGCIHCSGSDEGKDDTGSAGQAGNAGSRTSGGGTQQASGGTQESPRGGSSSLGGANLGGTTATDAGTTGELGGEGGVGGGVESGVGGGVGGRGEGGSSGAAQPGFCAGFTDEGMTTPVCTSRDDCERGSCNVITSCLSCQNPELECASDGDCGQDAECVKYTPDCSCAATQAAHCLSPCQGGYCEVGEVCRDGQCEPGSCEEGSLCPSGSRCNPSSAAADDYGCEVLLCLAGEFECPLNTRCGGGGDPHGCRALNCVVSSDCGTCVFGVCRAMPAYCELTPSDE